MSEIIIVGGGTAGWMTALLLEKMVNKISSIHLVESSDIGVIGVGEGTTPVMKQFFRTLEITEDEWMPKCNATYKCGIRFPNWSTVKGYESYYHPFYSPLDKEVGEAFFQNANLRRRGLDVPANPTDFFVAQYLSKLGMAPKGKQPLPFDMDYAYHFDAGLLGQFLKDKALGKGVIHHIETVKDVQVNTDGNITALRFQSGLELQGDYFVDCSGFRAQLIEKALKSPFVSYADNLLNNAAVAIQTPTKMGANTLTETRSEALSNGWMWQIPLQSRQGNGYVYSDDFIDSESAENELRTTLGIGDDAPAKHLTMRVGRREEHWKNNCMAIGLSQGFIEPLEATALMLVQYSAELFARSLNRVQIEDQEPLRQQLNERVNNLFDGVRDYIVGHYKTNSRQDSEYWRINREDTPISNRLDDILSAWRDGQELETVLTQHKADIVYLRPSWYCLLAGMGQFPQDLKPNLQGLGHTVESTKVYCEKVTTYFKAQSEVLLDLKP